MGTLPTGPLRVTGRPADALAAGTLGEWTVTNDDVVFGDEDGVLFVPAAGVAAVLSLAEAIRGTERAQADRIRGGVPLRSQVRFDTFLAERARRPSLTFRDHLREVGGAIEV